MAQIETNIEAKNGKGVGFERIRRISVPKSTTV